MELHGQAMLDYLNGEEDAYCILRRDDGVAYPPIYARQFFYPDGLPELDQIAVERCVGRVLDIGAGAGSHSLVGERTLRFEYKGQTSDWFEWMHIDPETLGH